MRSMRRGIAPAYAVLVVTLIILTYLILFKIWFEGAKEQYELYKSAELHMRRLDHRGGIEVNRVELVFTHGWRAKLRIEIQNMGFYTASITGAWIRMVRCRVYSYDASPTGKLHSCYVIDADEHPKIWSEDGDTRIFPRERAWIESTKDFDILKLYAYLGTNTSYYIDIYIFTDVTTVTYRIAPKPGALELTIYVDNDPPTEYDIQLYRLEPPGSGLAYEFYNRKDYRTILGHAVTHVELENLIPGKYLMIVKATSARTGEEVSIAIPITVDPQETETIPLILYSKPIPPFRSTQSFWELDFTDIASIYIDLIRNLSYWWIEGDIDVDWSATDYDWPGLKLFVHTNGSVFFKTPELAEGRYSIVIVYRAEQPPGEDRPGVMLTKLRIDGEEAPFNASCRKTKRDPCASLDWYECIAVATKYLGRGKHIVEAFFENTGGEHLRISRVGIYPYVGFRERVITLITTLWLGDVYVLKEFENGSAVLTKNASGYIAFYPCDNASTTPSRYPSDEYWFWTSTPHVRGNSTETWLFNLRNQRSRAGLSFEADCNTSCYVYAWAMIRPVSAVAQVWLYVDGSPRDVTSSTGVFQLLRAEIEPGKHTVTIEATIGSQQGLAKIYIDHVLVVKNSTITIEGLKPGYIVRIIDLSKGQIVYEAKATSSTMVIDAETIGIHRFPMNAMIQVIRS